MKIGTIYVHMTTSMIVDLDDKEQVEKGYDILEEELHMGDGHMDYDEWPDSHYTKEDIDERVKSKNNVIDKQED